MSVRPPHKPRRTRLRLRLPFRPLRRLSIAVTISSRKILLEIMKMFSALTVLDEDTKRRLQPSVRRGLQSWARQTAWREMVSDSIGMCVAVALVFALSVGLVILTVAMSGFVERSRGIQTLVGAICGTAFTILTVNETRASRFNNVRAVRKVLFGCTFVFSASVYLLYLNSEHRIHLDHSTTYFLSTLAGFIYFPAILGTSALLAVSSSALVDRVFRPEPDSLLVWSALRILVDLDDPTANWGSIARRAKLMRKLEGLIAAVEACGQYLQAAADSESYEWVRSAFQRVAAAVRERKKWLVLPRRDSRDEFTNSMKAFFEALVTCNWDALPQCDVDRAATRERFMTLARKWGSALASGGIPLVLFLALQNSPLALSAPVRDYAVGLLALWIVVVGISVCDPLFEHRVDSFRSLTQALPFGGKREK